MLQMAKSVSVLIKHTLRQLMWSIVVLKPLTVCDSNYLVDKEF